MDITCCLVNQSSTSIVVDKNLYETWTSKNHSLKHLLVFCCDAYVHVPKENKSKLDNKVEKYLIKCVS